MARYHIPSQFMGSHARRWLADTNLEFLLELGIRTAQSALLQTGDVPVYGFGGFARPLKRKPISGELYIVYNCQIIVNHPPELREQHHS